MICFGEILWDMLPEGKVLGGAPLNVLYHAQKQGMEGHMITAIGKDKLGEGIKDICSDLDLSLELIQEHDAFKTGVAAVSLDANGSASYELVKPVAYDHILEQAIQDGYILKCDAFVFGSLANRDVTTRSTLIKLLNKLKENKDCKIVFDINLRPPHYDLKVISDLMKFADILKLNEDELNEVASYHQLKGDYEELMNGLLRQFSLEAVVCTRGAEGALYIDKNRSAQVPGKKIDLVDTVGSGDAFLAAFVHSYLQNAPIESTLEKANNLGAFVASKRGAIVSY